MKGVVRFGKKKKLSPYIVGPHVIFQRIDKVFYELISVHPIFHVSMLKKCINDRESILPIELVQILSKQVKKLWNKQGGFCKGVMEKSPS